MHRSTAADRFSDHDPCADQQRRALMFAAHLAAGLAIKGAEPKVPAWAVLTGAFLPDLFWIGLAAVGIEPAGDTVFFDGWSHSVASILVQAILYAMCFYRRGRGVMLALGAAVLSHLLLDMPIHPRPLELYPHAMLVAGPPTWEWAAVPRALGKTRYWWLQLGLIAPLLILYWIKVRQKIASSLRMASCLMVAGLHLIS